MFCPKCGIDNMENAKFCRACGIDVSVLPLMLSGHLSAALEKNPKDLARALKEKVKEDKNLNWEEAMSTLFVGIAFLIMFLVGVVFMPKFFWIGIWFIIPALGCIGSGLGTSLQIMRKDKLQLQRPAPLMMPTPLTQHRVNIAQLPSKSTSEFMPAPPSVTENTTKYLGAELPTRVLDKEQ